MQLSIANAPCSWGVDFADAPTNPPWELVLTQIAEAGFRATELGPLGYLPTDVRLTEALEKRNLSVIAGTLFRPFSVASERESTFAYCRKSCSVLNRIGAKYLVVIDALSEDRMATAGRSAQAPRLSSSEWRVLISTIRDASRLAFEEFGIVPVLHSHAGTHLEFADELHRALEELPEDIVKLCIDTGHFTYAGIDPAKWIRDNKARLSFMHLKDVDGTKLAAARENKWGFFTAIAQGIFCPLGHGAVDFDDIRQSLREISYTGWAVVEQDCDPRMEPNPLRDAQASLQFLRQMKLAA